MTSESPSRNGDRGLSDRDDRAYAVDPFNNVVLEASAGTGKTAVLVDRYHNLLKAGADPAHILALTFTRKAAAEMRSRLVARLREAAERSDEDRARWHELRRRLGAIAIGTIDSFCLSLVREFPLEADVEPGFGLVDETEVPRVLGEALDQAMRRCLALARADPDVALVFARLGIGRVRAGLEHLLERRLAAPDTLGRFLARAPAGLTGARVAARAGERVCELLANAPGGLGQFIADGPLLHPRFQMLADDLARLGRVPELDGAGIRGVLEHLREHFLTEAGEPRLRPAHLYSRKHHSTAQAATRHRLAVASLAPAIADALEIFDRELNVVLARGVSHMFHIARDAYGRALEARGSLDFTEVLHCALRLLRQMDEFSQSRYRLESRYHHVLVDEFQDTSRAQWELISLLVRAWGEGMGLAAEAAVPPSLFIVGDHKQSIYGFRDADVGLLAQAAEFTRHLRPDSRPRRIISHSFRAVADLQHFTNDLFGAIGAEESAHREDTFRFTEADRFPVGAQPAADSRGPLGLIVNESPDACAAGVASEIERLLEEASVRDPDTGVVRQVRPGDVAILFRSRESHRELDRALDARGLPSYVYRGLGFFDADEVKDLVALLRYLADPSSDLRAAAFLRSRIVRLSDVALVSLAPHIAAALTASNEPPACHDWNADDRLVLAQVRASLPGWLSSADRVPPAELLDTVLSTAAYGFELRGPRLAQSRENVKKMRGLIRRIQNRGYATLARVSDHLQRLSARDESNAVVDALDAVHLLTVHAAKGLEFPIVFLADVTRGTGSGQPPIYVQEGGSRGEPLVSVGRLGSAAAEEETRRDREETKRLLYVAATRARDRLYWSAVVDNESLMPGQGSLAEVLPPSFQAVLRDAASAPAPPWVEWQAPAGRAHRLRVCRSHAGPAAQAPRGFPIAWVDDFARLHANSEGRRISVSELVHGPDDESAPSAIHDTAALAGRLAHRLLRVARTRECDAAELARLASATPRTDDVDGGEAVDVDGDRSQVISRAVRAVQALLNRPDVMDLLAGDCLFDVPFSIRLPDQAPAIVRGTLDCIVRHEDRRVTVIEFKTGAERPQHRAQLDLSVRAARALFPDARVDGELIYVA